MERFCVILVCAVGLAYGASYQINRSYSKALCGRFEGSGSTEQWVWVHGVGSGNGRLKAHLRSNPWYRPSFMLFTPEPLPEGAQVELFGRLVCSGALRKNGPQAAAERWVLRPVAQRRVLSRSRWVGLSGVLEGGMGRYPMLLALIRASWMGRGQTFGLVLNSFFRESGMLHVVALSAQHLVVLSGVIFFLLRSLVRISENRVLFFIAQHRVLIACLLLIVTSQGQPTLVRALSVLLAKQWFVSKRKQVRDLDLTLWCSGVFAVLLPSYASQTSFVLSTIASFWILQLSRLGVIRVLFFMPLCLAPVSLYYFGKLSLFSPMFNLFLNVFWNFFYLPLGFALPVVSHWISHGWLAHLESAVSQSFGWQLTLFSEWAHSGYWSFPGIGLVECVAFSMIVAVCVKKSVS